MRFYFKQLFQIITLFLVKIENLLQVKKKCHIICRQLRLTQEEQTDLTVLILGKSILNGMKIVKKLGTGHLLIIAGEHLWRIISEEVQEKEGHQINMKGDHQKNLQIDIKEGRLINMVEEIHLVKGILKKGLQKGGIKKGGLQKEEPQKEGLQKGGHQKGDLQTEDPLKEVFQTEDQGEEVLQKADIRKEDLQICMRGGMMTDTGGRNQKRKALSMVGGVQQNPFKQ